ncbi:hypothetical protein OC846_004850 [Tilletia horrida]|uniref:Pet127-domain-containing protein n=1 Tax=Tilletia horrida TaxID=155126 RepID=A0AAN6JQ21_9BASI|nr:hypothetical protein OC845_005590 [Tilletia horrida]KAK0547432.1 hypothetical protein OC846_004850 [Tilletia horrida]KAK0561900.1 hypothetical protein OC861_005596 [Tilletia horrida]
MVASKKGSTAFAKVLSSSSSGAGLRSSTLSASLLSRISELAAAALRQSSAQTKPSPASASATERKSVYPAALTGSSKPSPSSSSTPHRSGPSSAHQDSTHTSKPHSSQLEHSPKRPRHPAFADHDTGSNPSAQKPKGSGPIATRDHAADVVGAMQGTFSGLALKAEPVTPLRQMKIAKLAHGLDRVLFNPGVHWLRDPRTGIYNYPPALRNVLDPDLFDYDALPPYITSSEDNELHEVTRRSNARYCGSTSSLTALLSHCYFLISGRKPPNLTGFSEGLASLPLGFSAGASLPASIKLIRKKCPKNTRQDIYAVDNDKTASGELENSNYILAALGKSMEKMLTVDGEEFRRFGKLERWKPDGVPAPPFEPEAYHYSKLSRFLMRSQLDCHDDRLPNKTFDLKTRAVVAVRQDRANWIESSGYQIRSNLGVLESFEREYYDMVRAAFLKYGFQARIGNMDGIFVAYHNTKNIFGFQYVSLEEIFERVFGTVEMGEQAFALSVRLLEAILDSATRIYPEQSLKLTMSVEDNGNPTMQVLVERLDDKPSESTVSGTGMPGTDDPFGRSIDEAISQGNTASRGKPGNVTSKSESRSLVQIDVKVDRFLDGALIQGQPVDFSKVQGRNADPRKEDAIARNLRNSMAPLDWTVAYTIQPRVDLSEQEVEARLLTARKVQTSLTSLIQPNLEAVASRDVGLESVIRKSGGEAAVSKWREERREGKIGRMPRAPGQVIDGQEAAAAEEEADSDVSADVSDQDTTTDKGSSATSTDKDAAAGSEASAAPGQLPYRKRPVDLGEGTWARNSRAARRVTHLRELARLGAKDRATMERLDVQQRV